jgi:hypothetical protein
VAPLTASDRTCPQSLVVCGPCVARPVWSAQIGKVPAPRPQHRGAGISRAASVYEHTFEMSTVHTAPEAVCG